MKNSLNGILSLSSFTAFAMVFSTAFASDTIGNGKYGAAPASLDYPVTSVQAPSGASKSSKKELLAMQQEELHFLSLTNPFPIEEIAPIDPLSKEKVDHVLVGPAFTTRAYGSTIDYYRYVTFYNVSYRKTRIFELPVLREDCNDSRTFAVGSYNYSHTYSATVKAGVSYQGLGLDASFSTSRTFSTTRNIYGGGVIAEHTPYFIKADWEGRTFIQTLSSVSGQTAFILKEKSASPWWYYILFPMLSHKKYPYPFSVKDADWQMQIERTIIGLCE